MADLTENIENTAQGPKSHSVDGETATAQDLDKLVQADKYLKQQAASRSGRRMGGIRLGGLRSSGSTGAN